MKRLARRGFAFNFLVSTLITPMVIGSASGNAAVVLTLPQNAGTVQVTAEGPYGLGHPEVVFTETVE